MRTLEPTEAGRARRRASCCSTVLFNCSIFLLLSSSRMASACVLRNLSTKSNITAGVSQMGGGAGGPVAPPGARSSSAPLPLGPPATPARLATRGHARAHLPWSPASLSQQVHQPACRHGTRALLATSGLAGSEVHRATRAPPPAATHARNAPAAAAACPGRRARGRSCAGRTGCGASRACPASACCGGGTAAGPRGHPCPPNLSSISATYSASVTTARRAGRAAAAAAPRANPSAAAAPRVPLPAPRRGALRKPCRRPVAVYKSWLLRQHAVRRSRAGRLRSLHTGAPTLTAGHAHAGPARGLRRRPSGHAPRGTCPCSGRAACMA